MWLAMVTIATVCYIAGSAIAATYRAIQGGAHVKQQLAGDSTKRGGCY